MRAVGRLLLAMFIFAAVYACTVDWKRSEQFKASLGAKKTPTTAATPTPTPREGS